MKFKGVMVWLRFPVLTKGLFERRSLIEKTVYLRLFCTEIKPFEELILKNTVISTNHLTPELKLRLITPECDLWHCKGTESQFPNDPFWGIYWPGGQALGRYILDNKDLFHQKCVLDIGSGSGACALAAAKSGAKVVVGNDIDPVSISAIGINSKLNGLNVHTCQCDLIEKDIDSLTIKSGNETLRMKWNIILIGDMFYNSEFSSKLFIWLLKLVKQNKLVLVGDPGRHVLKDFEINKTFGKMVKIAEYSLHNNEHNGFSYSSVLKVCQCLVEEDDIKCEKKVKVLEVIARLAFNKKTNLFEGDWIRS